MQKVLVKCLKLRLYHLTERQEPKTEKYYKEDFFGKETNLRFRDNWKEKLYDGFGSFILLDQPLERKTQILRHLAEFWMIEPEVAFNDLNDNMDLAEDFIQYVIKYTMDKCEEI
jgi:asparaginyl-tRNA synthetase